MKKMILLLPFLLAVTFLTCEKEPEPIFFILQQTPTAADFNISNLTQTVYDITAVTITPKAGKSRGDITVYYNNSITLPDTDGTYAVTFDIAAVTGWKAASDLSAGTLTITDGFTSVADFATWLKAQPDNTAVTPYTVKLNLENNYQDNNKADFTNLSIAFATIVFATGGNRYVYLDLSGSTITFIPKHAFYLGPSTPSSIPLIGITLPASVVSIYAGAFRDCSNLASITIPNGLVSIGQEDYYENYSSIYYGVFNGCTSLTSITIPASVSIIDDFAFNKCYLTRVTFEGTINKNYFSPMFSYNNNSVFPGDLRDKFYATDPDNGTSGTYSRPSTTSTVWTKQ